MQYRSDDAVALLEKAVELDPQDDESTRTWACVLETGKLTLAKIDY